MRNLETRDDGSRVGGVECHGARLRFRRNRREGTDNVTQPGEAIEKLIANDGGTARVRWQRAHVKDVQLSLQRRAPTSTCRSMSLHKSPISPRRASRIPCRRAPRSIAESQYRESSRSSCLLPARTSYPARRECRQASPPGESSRPAWRP